MSIKYNEALAELSKFPVMVTDADGIGEDKWMSYEQFVCNLVKDMGSVDNDMTHMILGIAGEAGEIVDAIKKRVIYDKPLNLTNVVEELGDLEFYMAGLRQVLGIRRSETLDANIAKLQVRYKDGYSDAAAVARADKQPSRYELGLAEGKAVAINLPAAAVEGTDDMAGLEVTKVDPVLTVPPVPVPDSPPVQPLP